MPDSELFNGVESTNNSQAVYRTLVVRLVAGTMHDLQCVWVSDKQPLTDIKNWRQISQANFQKLLVAAADKFPAHDPAENEKQSHVTILVHGFNNKFTSATRF